MSDHIFCLSKTDQPGLIRLTARSANGVQAASIEREILEPGESVEWSLKVRDAKTVLHTIKRSMNRFRKCRGKGVFRCCPMEARSIAVKNATAGAREFKLGENDVHDNVYATMLTIAFLVTVFCSQTAELGTKNTLALTATVLTALIIGTAYLKSARSKAS